jgi:hypothetical protein
MKKIEFGSIEILGYIGGLIWGTVVLLRGSCFSDNSTYLFITGVLPNLGAAWMVTMFSKWIILFVCKQDYTIKKHCIICFGIIIIAFASELIHHSFLNSPFDIYDMIITIISQLMIIIVPVITKDKYFENYC